MRRLTGTQGSGGTIATVAPPVAPPSGPIISSLREGLSGADTQSFSDDFTSTGNFTDGRYLLEQESIRNFNFVVNTTGVDYTAAGATGNISPTSGDSLQAIWYDTQFRAPEAGNGIAGTITIAVDYALGYADVGAFDESGVNTADFRTFLAIGLAPMVAADYPADNAVVQAQIFPTSDDSSTSVESMGLYVQGESGPELVSEAPASDGPLRLGKLTLVINIAPSGEEATVQLYNSPYGEEGIEAICETTITDPFLVADMLVSSSAFVSVVSFENDTLVEPTMLFDWSWSCEAVGSGPPPPPPPPPPATPSTVTGGTGSSGALRAERRITGVSGSGAGPATTVVHDGGGGGTAS